ncbi:MAG: acetate--CoA ligase [Myxococcota bacterium]|nr:acetate--CoA ligase [Myxococcota bacterium]
MTDIFAVPSRVAQGSEQPLRTIDAYRAAVHRWRSDPDGFWLGLTNALIQWDVAPTVGLVGGYDTVQSKPFEWFSDGQLNVTTSCVDRHAAHQPDKTAILWEGDAPGEARRISYGELKGQVNRLANGLTELGVGPGDRVIIYMGMIPEAAIAMLACARIGAVHSVVFGGFSADALRDRIQDCGARVVITQDEGLRGGRVIPLKATVDEAIDDDSQIDSVLVFKRTDGTIEWRKGRDVEAQALMARQSDECQPLSVSAEHPLFILYTSGSTGRPKGVVHTSGGYLTYAAFTHRTVFDLRADDVYACMADVGWITGHSYIVYGPLANGATTLMFESTPMYPDAGRYWDVVERYGVTIFYTAPTAIRALAAEGDAFVTKYNRSTLRVLGTVGEPINPDAWLWYHEVVGETRCTIVDTWWQTETGGICISPIAPVTPTKPGSATLPLPGIDPILFDPETQRPCRGPAQGHLCLSQPWPGQARTVYGDHARYVETYFSAYPGYYFTGDGCRRDVDGYHWITGRIDDVLNVAGHRMGTAEFEAALIHSDLVAEAAVVGFPHPIKGQGVYAFVVLQDVDSAPNELSDVLNQTVRRLIGAHAKIDAFQWVPGLPKTRSGKVMRRILRCVAHQEYERLGDVSTLADPSVVQAIIDGASSTPLPS